MQIRHANRINAMQPRKGLHWCRCDRTMINPAQRCNVCGRKQVVRRLKKAPLML